MSRATPEMRSIAQLLLLYETPRRKSSTANPAAAFPVIDKLHPHLMNLMGNLGSRTLLMRALLLAQAQVLWLSAVHMKDDGTLDGLDALQSHLDPAEFLEGGTVLLAQLLGLLVAFIGPGLTSDLVTEIWPRLSFKETDFGKEPKNEKTK
jgi:hypothetical protein